MNISGKSAILAYSPNVSTAWGTALTIGVTHQLFAESLGPLINPSEIVPDPHAGYAYHKYIDLARQNVTPEISGLLPFSGRPWSFIAQLMGDDAKSGTPVTHLMTLLEAIDGSYLYGTMGLQLGPAAGELLFEWPSVKPTGFTIEGPNGNGYMTYTIRTIADTMKLGADCTLTTAAIDNVTFITLNSLMPPPVPFGAVQFRMNAGSGGALGSGDVVKIKSLNLTFNRQFGPEWTSRGAAASQWKTDEPIENGIPEQSLSIELGDLNVLTYLEAFQDETEYKADITIPFGVYSILMQFPCLKFVVPDATLAGSNRITQTLNFNMMESLANPTGMAFNLWRITVVDDHNVAYMGF